MTPQELPTKPPRDAASAAIRREGPAKPDSEDAVAPQRESRRREKAALDEDLMARQNDDQPEKQGDQDHGDQRASPGGVIGGGGQGYVRLTVRADQGQFSVVDSHFVAGPLGQATSLQGGYAYEVTAGGQLLHADSIPDLGEYRSFAHPEGSGELLGHHRYPMSRYEFDVRVPLDMLERADPSAVSIMLYRVKQPDPLGAPPRPPIESLARSRGDQLREIGRVTGLPPGLIEGDQEQRAPTQLPDRPMQTKLRSSDEGRDRDEG